MSRSPLARLILRAQDGDLQALDQVVLETQGMGLRLCWSMMGDRQRAEDALQDVYLAVFRHLGRLRDPEAFRAWFLRICANRCRRLLRRRPERSLEELPDDPSTTGGLEKARRRHLARELLARLPARDRGLLLMRENLSLSYQEIAELQGVPVGTVKSRLFEARRRLLHLLEAEP